MLSDTNYMTLKKSASHILARTKSNSTLGPKQEKLVAILNTKGFQKFKILPIKIDDGFQLVVTSQKVLFDITVHNEGMD